MAYYIIIIIKYTCKNKSESEYKYKYHISTSTSKYVRYWIYILKKSFRTLCPMGPSTSRHNIMALFWDAAASTHLHLHIALHVVHDVGDGPRGEHRKVLVTPHVDVEHWHLAGVQTHM